MSFGETFDFWPIFFVGYAVYLGVVSVVSIFWIVSTRLYRLAFTDPSTGFIGAILRGKYKLVFSLLRLGRSPAGPPPERPSYRQIFTVAGTSGVVLATSSGIIVVSLQWMESLA